MYLKINIIKLLRPEEEIFEQRKNLDYHNSMGTKLKIASGLSALLGIKKKGQE